jgi:hypothetical protein
MLMLTFGTMIGRASRVCYRHRLVVIIGHHMRRHVMFIRAHRFVMFRAASDLRRSSYAL